MKHEIAQVGALRVEFCPKMPESEWFITFPKNVKKCPWCGTELGEG